MFMFLVFLGGSEAYATCEDYPGTGNLGENCCLLELNTGWFGKKYKSGQCNTDLYCNLETGKCVEAKGVCGKAVGGECCNWVYPYAGSCDSELGLSCDTKAGKCQRKPGGTTTEPWGDPGKCQYIRDTNSSDKECKLIDQCNYRNGWMGIELSDPLQRDLYPNCPQCTCGKNPHYQLDTCQVYPFDQYRIMTKFMFCGPGMEPEIYLSANNTTNCRCIVEGSIHNIDYVGDKLQKYDKEWFSKASNSVISGVGVRLFCEPIDKNNPKVYTALGCLPVSVTGFTAWIIPNLFGIIGGICFLVLVYGFIMVATSAGDPKKTQAAKETITAAITGLILSIFAIFIVRLIMIYILKIPAVR